MDNNFTKAITTLIIIAIAPTVSAEELRCSVTWSSGTYEGTGSSINRAMEDARDICHDNNKLGSHECGSSPINIDCIDKKGKCVNRSEFLHHGLNGGDQC